MCTDHTVHAAVRLKPPPFIYEVFILKNIDYGVNRRLVTKGKNGSSVEKRGPITKMWDANKRSITKGTKEGHKIRSSAYTLNNSVIWRNPNNCWSINFTFQSAFRRMLILNSYKSIKEAFVKQSTLVSDRPDVWPFTYVNKNRRNVGEYTFEC